MATSLLWNDSMLKHAGMEALAKNLGLVECERFIALIRREQPFDYTEWRQTLFDDMTTDELYDAVREFREKLKIQEQ